MVESSIIAALLVLIAPHGMSLALAYILIPFFTLLLVGLMMRAHLPHLPSSLMIGLGIFGILVSFSTEYRLTPLRDSSEQLQTILAISIQSVSSSLLIASALLFFCTIIEISLRWILSFAGREQLATVFPYPVIRLWICITAASITLPLLQEFLIG